MLKIKINGRNYYNFNNVNLDLRYDSLASTFSFDGYFDPDNIEHRKLFRPLSYHSIQIWEENVLLISGYILSHKFSASSKNNLVPVSGYAKTGILGDISIPTSLYPLETNKKNLKEITERLIEPFGIGLVIDSDVEEDALKLYDKSNSDGKDTIGGYISELACQRNIIVTHTPAGNLRFTRPQKVGAAVAIYDENMPSIQMDIEFNGQGLHSHLTVLRQGTVGSDIEADVDSVNPMVLQYRPLVKEQTKGAAGDADKAAKNALSDELKNIVLTIETDRWTWNNDRAQIVMRPNNYITVSSPKCFLSTPSNWFVQSVVLSESSEGRKAVMTCVMPESFNDDSPKSVFDND